MNLDTVNGILSGNASVGTIVTAVDTISFKVEDSIGRFVVYNYLLTRKRSSPFFFTKFDDNKTIYCVPQFSHALQNISQSASLFFYFSNPAINITGLSVENNSLIKINTNIPVTAFDKIGYQGFDNLNGVTYFNGIKMENFGLTRIRLDAVSKNIAVAGMMRFNTSSGKFEYFNGQVWVNMN